MSKVRSCVLILLSTVLVLAQPHGVLAQSDRVDSCVASQMANRHIPGLALSVIRDGIPVKVKGYGIANIELSVPVNPETIFQSGSVGKQFTSMLVMQLVEQNRIGLDDPISNYLTESPDTWKKITVRHLLTHTSGIADFTTDSLGFDLRADYTEEQLAEKAKRLPLDFQPGERWSYSNTGYVLLGILIHKITGQFYGDLLRENVFRPLSMETARIISEADVIPNRAAGYRLERGEWMNQEWVSPSLNTTADGSLYLTILDLVKWDAALSSGKLISKTSYDQMWSPVRLKGDSLHPYGFGWSLRPINGHKAVSHTGSWQGFNSCIVRYLDDRLTIVILANSNRVHPGRIAQAVAGMYVPGLAEREVSPIPDREPQFTAVVYNLFQKPDTMDVNPELFTKEYQPKVRALLRVMLDHLNSIGPVVSVEMVGYDNIADGTITQYRIRSKAGSSSATITRTKAGQIAGIVIGLE